jgi:channel protein (hemolysin III family)
MSPSREVLASADRYPGQISWDYDRAEIIADGAVHATGVCLGLIGAVTIVVIAVRIERIEVAPILVYVIGLVTMLALSAAYNMWPVSRAKWVLRRFDHSAIYLLIAGTYTPFLAQMKSVLALAGLGPGVWLSAVIGIALKLALPGRFDRLAIVLCLLLGWSGVIAPPEREPMASRDRRHSLFSRRALSCLAGPALSQCDLARFRADRRKLPLFGGPRVLAMGISRMLGKNGAFASSYRWKSARWILDARLRGLTGENQTEESAPNGGICQPRSEHPGLHLCGPRGGGKAVNRSA